MTDFYSISAFITLVLLVIASWKTQRWLAMTATALTIGAEAVFALKGEYLEFSFYLFQLLLLLLGTAFFVQGRRQKLVVGLAAAVLVAAGLIKNSLQLDHFENIQYSIYLFATYALLPLLFYSPVKNREENLEKTICLQQTWLRILFFYWSLEQGINISHYDLYRRFVVEIGGIALVVILLAVFWRRRFFWTLVQQSVLSLLVLCVGMNRTNNSSQMIFAWVLLLSLATLLPKEAGEGAGNRTRFLKRMEFGAFGGGVFWSLLLIVHLGATASIEGSMLWTFIAFLIGFFSWLRDIPGPAQTPDSMANDVFMLGARALVQILLASIFIYPV